MATFWADLDASRWVYRLGMLQTAIACLFTVGLTLLALPLGPVALAIPALAGALAAFSAWTTSAWRRGRPWAWWVWTVSSGLGAMKGLFALAAGGSSWSAWWPLVSSGGMLLVLAHRENRKRANGPVEPLPLNAHPAYISHRT